jgi:hypothetical protein
MTTQSQSITASQDAEASFVVPVPAAEPVPAQQQSELDDDLPLSESGPETALCW